MDAFSLLAHDAALGILKELDNLPDLRPVGHLILNLVDHIEHTGLAMEQQTVGIGDVLLYLRIDLCIVHHRSVRTAVGHRVTTGNDIRRYVVREGATSLDQRKVTSTGIRILDSTRREDDTIAYHAVACH